VELITGQRRRRRWTAEEKARIVAESFEEGANMSEVARLGVVRGLLSGVATPGNITGEDKPSGAVSLRGGAVLCCHRLVREGIGVFLPEVAPCDRHYGLVETNQHRGQRNTAMRSHWQRTRQTPRPTHVNGVPAATT
jgi:hypothetical protein